MQATRYQWSRLDRLQLSRYAEYLVKMEFTRLGCDVYTAEVDDKGIDFVIRNDKHQHYDVQVKSVRNNSYIYLRTGKFEPRGNLYLAIVRFIADGQDPVLYLVPSSTCQQQDSPFKHRRYHHLKSQPEWGLDWTTKTLARLEQFRFDRVVAEQILA
jgi:hypothetical protein